MYVGVAAFCIPGSVYVVAYSFDPCTFAASTIALLIDKISFSVKFIHIVVSDGVPSTSGISTSFFATTM